MDTRVLIDDDRVVVSLTQDCADLAEMTTAMRNEGLHGSSEMRLAARIPDIFIEDYCYRSGITYEEWVQNPEHIKRVLEDPALATFRVWPGRI